MREGEKEEKRHPDLEDLEGEKEDGDESGGHEGEKEEALEPGENRRKEERKERQRQPTNSSRGPRLED